MNRIVASVASAAIAVTGLAYAQGPGGGPSTDGPGSSGRAERPHDPQMRFQRADTNRDGRLSLQELQSVRPGVTRERFDQLDRDGDGFLSQADRPDRGRGGQRDAAQRTFVKKLLQSDANQDGRVTLEELRAEKPGFPEDSFARLDRDSDGGITLQDLDRRGQPGDRPRRPEGQARPGRGAPEPRAGMRERLQKADSNADGKVSQEEALAAFPGMTLERFERMDRNGDGFLTRADRPQRPPRPRP